MNQKTKKKSKGLIFPVIDKVKQKLSISSSKQRNTQDHVLQKNKRPYSSVPKRADDFTFPDFDVRI